MILKILSLFFPIIHFKNKLYPYLFKNVNFHKNVKLNNVHFEGYNSIYANTTLENSSVGLGSYVGNDCNIKNTKIGKFCSIAPFFKVSIGTHPTNTFVSTHPVFYSTKRQAGFTFSETQIFEEIIYLDDKNKTCVEIGNDVWIGTDVTVLMGVVIGDGSIIASGSVVNSDVEPYSIFGGVPAKLIKYRFPVDERNKLIKFKWWDKDFIWLKNNIKSFSNIKQFLLDFKL